MIRFNCDYNEGAHPRILETLVKTNMEQTPGYGEDPYCEKAAKVIKDLCKKEDAAVHFLVGGTQANLTVISSILRPYQAVLCVEEGHINVHETGAIEACGHKVMTVSGKDGKIDAEQIKEVYTQHWSDSSHEHMTQPKLVYISNPTELGTMYSKAELEAIRNACNECGLYLFLDGARLGYGLMAEGNDLTLEVLAENCDVFYIGGTKVGALFGEAVVICNKALQEDFRYLIKQKGGMLAKGRLLGIQFDTLFTDNLYFEISKHAIEMAEKLKEVFHKKGYTFFLESPTNQQFIILENEKMKELSENVEFGFWEKYDDNHTVVRFATSWSTDESSIDQLEEYL